MEENKTNITDNSTQNVPVNSSVSDSTTSRSGLTPTNEQPETKQPSRKKLFLVTLIGVLVAVALGGGYFFWQNYQKNRPVNRQPSSTPEVTATPDPYANWKTYTNSGNTISFKYPSDWKIIKSTDAELVIASTDKDIKISNIIEPAKGHTAIYFGFIHSALENYQDGIMEVKPSPDHPDILIEKGIFLNEGGSFGAQTYYWKDDINIDNYEKIYDQILSTFKFFEDLKIKANEPWLKYNATCSGLKDDVSVFYPQSWKIGINGEIDITDGPGGDPIKKSSECLIQFGFQEAPGYRQDPYVPGLYGYTTVGSVIVDKTANLTSIFEDWKDDMNEKITFVGGVEIVNIEGRDWVKVNFKDEPGAIMNTIHNGRLYMIQYELIEADKIVSSDREQLLKIEEEFVSRIEFH